MNKNDWMSIRTGDIVLVRDYPNPQYKEAHAAPTKTRFAVVIGNFRGGYATLPAHAIVTKGGKTEQPYYRLKENELRVPANIISDRSDIALKGVIKAHRFPLIRKEQMILKVGSLPLETKIQLIDIHETIRNRPIHVLEMEKENPYYAKFMGFFKEVTLAEKMQFMRDDRGNHQYEFVRNEEFRVKEIQLLEKRNHLHILSVQLEGDKGTFTHTFATKKSLQEIREDWKEPKKAKEWIREDVKFYALWKNPFLQLKPDPQPHPDKYQSLEKFREKSSVLER